MPAYSFSCDTGEPGPDGWCHPTNYQYFIDGHLVSKERYDYMIAITASVKPVTINGITLSGRWTKPQVEAIKQALAPIELVVLDVTNHSDEVSWFIIGLGIL